MMNSLSDITWFITTSHVNVFIIKLCKVSVKAEHKHSYTTTNKTGNAAGESEIVI